MLHVYITSFAGHSHPSSLQVFWLFVFIRAVFVIYLWGLVSLSLNTFQFHSLSLFTPSTMRLTCLSHSNYHISALCPMWTWSCDYHVTALNQPHWRLRTRLPPENLAQMSHHVMMHNVTHGHLTFATMSNYYRHAYNRQILLNSYQVYLEVLRLYQNLKVAILNTDNIQFPALDFGLISNKTVQMRPGI